MRDLFTALKWFVTLVGFGALIVVAFWTSPQWSSLLKGNSAETKTDKSEDDHSGHAHDDGDSLELSTQARLNIGLTPEKIEAVKVEPYDRKITIPAMVVGLPGKTKVVVVAPMTGIVKEVYAIEGESIKPGEPLFKIQLLHEDLVVAQSEFLKTLGSLDVEKKEIARLQKLAKEGALAERVLLERQYEEHKLEATLRAQREALRLHGLHENEIEQIEKTRKLANEFIIRSPGTPSNSVEPKLNYQTEKAIGTSQGDKKSGRSPELLVVQDLKANKGDIVQAGSELCVLNDFAKLYIQGRGFEQDVYDLTRAADNNWPITAVLEDNSSHPQMIKGLQIAYLDHEIEMESRAFYFYVDLPNKIINRRQTSDGHQFVTWKFRPGQRMQLLVPVEQWQEKMVLPVEALAKEGAEYYAFVENGSSFDRRPVHVIYRDQFNAVIANDGSLFPGERVAMTGAHQMQMALKNKAGGGVDPHAGHNH